MLHTLAMFERAKDIASFSEIPTKEESLLARLKGNKSHVMPTGWQSPQESVGRRCCKIGEYVFWEVKDPARTKLASLEVLVQDLLNDHNEHLKEREACNLSFSIFMVGRNESTSCPTLVIISSNEKSRKKVVDIIRKSGIIDKYQGVLLLASSKHPRYPESGPAKWIASESDADPSPTQPYGSVYIKKSIADDGYITSGTPIYVSIEEVSEETSRFRKATLGGFLMLRRETETQTKTSIVGMTVAHAFQDSHLNDYTIEESDDDSFEIEFDGQTPDSIFGGDSSSRDFKSSSSFNQKTCSPHPAYETQFTMEKQSELTRLGVVRSTSIISRSDLDWALIEITAKELFFSNDVHKGLGKFISPVRNLSTVGTAEIAVVTCTGSTRTRAGIMSDHSTFIKMKYANSFVEVRTVTFDGSITYGDSGSWIVETESGKLSGHIVAGDLSTGLGYVSPAKAAFQEIERQLHCRVELPESGSLDSESFFTPAIPLNTKGKTTQPISSTTVKMKEDVAKTDRGKITETTLPQDGPAVPSMAESILETLGNWFFS
ncbi:hypothetical protein V8E51_019432 [Hyaloscypha variabilis]